jgi:galactokinase
MSDAVDRALAAARRTWGRSWSPVALARAPGRLELLGNHVDYNGGKVLAAAINRDVICLVGRSSTAGIDVVVADVGSEHAWLDAAELAGWHNQTGTPRSLDYVKGVIATGLAAGEVIRQGISIAIAGDLPIGFGLSSSAALCVALTLALHRPTPDGRELVLRAQAAEHRAGTPCGTMDQSASVGGNVILFDGATVSWQAIVPDLGDFVFTVADSGVSRSLGASSYPTRVEESRTALATANRLLPRTYGSLSEIEQADLEWLLKTGDDAMPLVYKRRVRHVVTERERVAAGVEAMRAADWPRFGELMNASGASSADDYEISHPDVEQIVAIALATPGVVGARMMGGGEGGTALLLLEKRQTDAVRRRLDERYYARRGMDASRAVRVFQFARGASLEPARSE